MSRKSNIIKFLMDEQGLELSEYAVAAALVALATVAGVHSAQFKDRHSDHDLGNYIP
jgi:Flp pilus assembly pilin Flp